MNPCVCRAIRNLSGSKSVSRHVMQHARTPAAVVRADIARRWQTGSPLCAADQPKVDPASQHKREVLRRRCARLQRVLLQLLCIPELLWKMTAAGTDLTAFAACRAALLG